VINNLYYSRSGNSLRAVIAAMYSSEEVGFSYIDMSKNVQKSASFLRLNSRGQVPVLKTSEGSVLLQSGAIAEYFVRDTSLEITKSYDGSLIRQFCYSAVSDFAPPNAFARYLSHHKDIDEWFKFRLLNLFSNDFDSLKRNDFLSGNNPSLADVFHFPVAYMRQCLIQDATDLQHVTIWINRCLEIPEFNQAVDIAGLVL